MKEMSMTVTVVPEEELPEEWQKDWKRAYRVVSDDFDYLVKPNVSISKLIENIKKEGGHL